MCVLFKQDTAQGQTQETKWRKHARSHHGETHYRSRKGFFLRNKITRKGPVGCKLTFLHRVPSKSSSSAIPPRWSTNYTTSATGAAKLHLPRKAKIKLVRTHGPSVFYFYLELNQSDSESEGLPNLVFWFALISHLPATVARAHEHSKNTNKRTGPEEAPCSPHNSPSSTTVFKLYDSGQKTKHVYVCYHGI